YIFKYTVTPADQDSECDDDDALVTITIDDLPPTPTPQVEPADCINDNSDPQSDPVYLGSVAFTYPGDSGIDSFYYIYKESTETDYSDPPILYPGPISLPAGTYDFKFLLEIDGCESDPLQVTINQLPSDPLDITLNPIQPDCATNLGGIEVTHIGLLGGADVNVEDYLFSLFDNDADPLDPPLEGYDGIEYPEGGFTNLPPGNYRVFALGKNGCNSGTAITELLVPECMVCETAFAKRNDTPDSPNRSYCFIDERPDETNFNWTLDFDANRWGWTNFISISEFTVDNDYTFSMDLYAAAGQCDINKGTLVGSVDVTYTGDEEGGTVSVSYNMLPGYWLGGVHVYVGQEPYMWRQQGNKEGEYTVAPGQYPFNSDNAGEYTYLETIEPISVEGVTGFYVIAHADVCTTNTEEYNQRLLTEAEPITIQLNERKNSMIYSPSSRDKQQKTTITSSTSLVESADPLFYVAPNPFTNSELNFYYMFDYTSNVTIQIYDLNGRLLRTYTDTLVNSTSTSTFNVDFKTRSGQVYIVRLATDREIFTSKILSGN
ncbi:T9SS type A sorting domain-containing protein, partial [Christiangramia crocea]